MALEIKDVMRPAAGAMYVAPERLYVTADDEVVGDGDERAVRLLVAKGCEIPASEARRYGLVIPVGGDEASATEGDGGDASGGDVEPPQRRKK